MSNLNLINLNDCYKPNQRMVVLDTETTGLDYGSGDRLIEIGCVEIINNKITGKFFQSYINPQRDVSAGSYRVTGISTSFLKDKPLFNDIVDDFLKFIDGSILVIHNANFDVPFINYELGMLNKSILPNKILDTLLISREIFVGKPCNLDAVCKRLNIDNSIRSFHGALLDAQILSKVYLMLLNIRKNQTTIDLLVQEETVIENNSYKIQREKISIQWVKDEELKIHNEFFIKK